MTCIFGVDIIKGSLQGKIKPRYAVFIIDDGNEIEKFGVSRSKLFRMIREFKPAIVSVDNIYELCERLRDGGVTINRPPRDGHMAFVRSPDGISIELLQKGESLPVAEPWASMPNSGEW